MSGPIKLKVFVASPGDVSKERKVVRSVLEEMDRTFGRMLQVSFEPFLWEDDLGPGVDEGGPQGLVDAHSNLATCDVLVGIFWNRLGTPTSDGTTGTQHEFLESFKRWQRDHVPQIMLYFSKRKIDQTANALDQGKLLLGFRDALPKEVLYWQYESPQEFEKLFREQFTRHVLQVWNERGRPKDKVRFSDSTLKLGLVSSGPDLIRTNADIVSEAEEIFYATGSRSRDASYLKAIEDRLAAVPKLIHYRVLVGPPFRALFKDHLSRLIKLRPPEDRSQGFKTLFIGLFEKTMQQAEVFIAGNEKRALIVLPSRKGLGEYNTALVIDDKAYVQDLIGFVKQLYAAGQSLESLEAIATLKTLLPAVPSSVPAAPPGS